MTRTIHQSVLKPVMIALGDEATEAEIEGDPSFLALGVLVQTGRRLDLGQGTHQRCLPWVHVSQDTDVYVRQFTAWREVCIWAEPLHRLHFIILYCYIMNQILIIDIIITFITLNSFQYFSLKKIGQHVLSFYDNYICLD